MEDKVLGRLKIIKVKGYPKKPIPEEVKENTEVDSSNLSKL